MNVTPPKPLAQKVSPPRLRPARFEDYPQIQQLESSHLADSLPTSDWHSLFLDNPLWPRLGGQWPIGWVLENDSGIVVGSLTNFPSLYRFHGKELICANGRSWVVAAEYIGFALWLMDEYYNQGDADLFINTTVGPKGTAAANMYSTRVPVGDWQTIAYWVIGYRGFAQKALAKLGVPLPSALAIPAAAALWMKDALFSKRLPVVPNAVVIEAADDFDQRFDFFWEELLRQNSDRLLGVRNRPALAWHYGISSRRGRLWILTASRNGLLRAWCVLMRPDRRQGLRRMRLIDYQSLETDADLLPALLEAAFERCAAEDIYVLEHLGCGLPKMHNFDRLAPYRRKLPSWQFYYRAVDPTFASELCKPQVWDPSEFDGDACFV